MKAYKILALLERVEKMEAGDKRVLINGFPCKVDFRMIAEDLFEDAVSALKETIEELEQVKNCSIPDVSHQRELLKAFLDYVDSRYSEQGTGDKIVDEFLSL